MYRVKSSSFQRSLCHASADVMARKVIEKRARTQDRLRSSAAVSVRSRRSRRSRRGLQVGSAIGQLPLAKIVLDERSNPEKYTLPGRSRLAAGADDPVGSRRS